MINILLSGCTGKMGITISKLVNQSNEYKISAGINSSGISKDKFPVYFNIFDVQEEFDIILDFSKHDQTEKILKFDASRNKPVVIATTGHTKEEYQIILDYSKKIPIFFSPNTSIGINLLIDLVQRSVPVIQKNNFDIEIVEKHHNKKIDAPSGTALKIADAISNCSSYNYDYIYDRHLHNENRSKNEIGIHSIRCGTIVGEHSVIFAGEDEIIEIKHTALSKNIFAKGALNALNFMLDKPHGLYTMSDLLKDNILF